MSRSERGARGKTKDCFDSQSEAEESEGEQEPKKQRRGPTPMRRAPAMRKAAAPKKRAAAAIAFVLHYQPSIRLLVADPKRQNQKGRAFSILKNSNAHFGCHYIYNFTR